MNKQNKQHHPHHRHDKLNGNLDWNTLFSFSNYLCEQQFARAPAPSTWRLRNRRRENFCHHIKKYHQKVLPPNVRADLQFANKIRSTIKTSSVCLLSSSRHYQQIGRTNKHLSHANLNSLPEVFLLPGRQLSIRFHLVLNRKNTRIIDEATNGFIGF